MSQYRVNQRSKCEVVTSCEEPVAFGSQEGIKYQNEVTEVAKVKKIHLLTVGYQVHIPNQHAKNQTKEQTKKDWVSFLTTPLIGRSRVFF